MDPAGGEIVHVYLGDDQPRRYAMPLSLIARSPTMQNLIHDNGDGHLSVVLRHVPPKLFIEVINWLQGNCFSATVGQNGGSLSEAYARIWLLAAYLALPKLQNYAMDLLVRLYKEHKSACPTPETLTVVYQFTTAASPLRRFVSDWCLARMAPEKLRAKKARLPRELLAELNGRLHRNGMARVKHKPDGPAHEMRTARYYVSAPQAPLQDPRPPVVPPPAYQASVQGDPFRQGPVGGSAIYGARIVEPGVGGQQMPFGSQSPEMAFKAQQMPLRNGSQQMPFNTQEVRPSHVPRKPLRPSYNVREVYPSSMPRRHKSPGHKSRGTFYYTREVQPPPALRKSQDKGIFNKMRDFFPGGGRRRRSHSAHSDRSFPARGHFESRENLLHHTRTSAHAHRHDPPLHSRTPIFLHPPYKLEERAPRFPNTSTSTTFRHHSPPPSLADRVSAWDDGMRARPQPRSRSRSRSFGSSTYGSHRSSSRSQRTATPEPNPEPNPEPEPDVSGFEDLSLDDSPPSAPPAARPATPPPPSASAHRDGGSSGGGGGGGLGDQNPFREGARVERRDPAASEVRSEEFGDESTDSSTLRRRRQTVVNTVANARLRRRGGEGGDGWL